jgi:dephospho-CoA kinase
MIVIGLTGSIGMGKTTTAAMFEREGVAALDSDAVVHQLYEGDAVRMIEAAFMGTTENNVVNREKLGEALRQNPAQFKVLEDIVHPLVQEKQRDFLDAQKSAGRQFALLDIPLLFETGAEALVDVTVVASCAPDIQRARVLSRPGMTQAKLDMILARQMPDEEKRQRADFVVDTGQGLDAAHGQVRQILSRLKTWKKGSDQHA